MRHCLWRRGTADPPAIPTLLVLVAGCTTAPNANPERQERPTPALDLRRPAENGVLLSEG